MKDNFNLKLILDADRNTVQMIRRVLAHDDTLRQKLIETAEAHIKAKGFSGRDFDLTGDLKISLPSEIKPGRRKGAHPLPVCDGETLTIIDFDTEDNKTTVAAVDSEDYFFYLDTLRSFRYEAKKLSMTVIKERRGKSLIWYAHKRIKGRLKRRYLGKSANLTSQKLYDAAFFLAQDDDLKRLGG